MYYMLTQYLAHLRTQKLPISFKLQHYTLICPFLHKAYQEQWPTTLHNKSKLHKLPKPKQKQMQKLNKENSRRNAIKVPSLKINDFHMQCWI